MPRSGRCVPRRCWRRRLHAASRRGDRLHGGACAARQGHHLHLPGWSMASVLGLPLSAWLGETFGWRFAFGAVAVASGAAAVWVATVMPKGIRPAALTLTAWKEAFSHACADGDRRRDLSVGRRAVHLVSPTSRPTSTTCCTPRRSRPACCSSGRRVRAGRQCPGQPLDRPHGHAPRGDRHTGPDRRGLGVLAGDGRPARHGHRPGAVGARLLFQQLGAAGAAERHRPEPGAGTAGAQHIGYLPRSGRRARRAAAG